MLFARDRMFVCLSGTPSFEVARMFGEGVGLPGLTQVTREVRLANSLYSVPPYG